MAAAWGQAAWGQAYWSSAAWGQGTPVGSPDAASRAESDVRPEGGYSISAAELTTAQSALGLG